MQSCPGCGLCSRAACGARSMTQVDVLRRLCAAAIAALALITRELLRVRVRGTGDRARARVSRSDPLKRAGDTDDRLVEHPPRSAASREIDSRGARLASLRRAGTRHPGAGRSRCLFSAAPGGASRRACGAGAAGQDGCCCMPRVRRPRQSRAGARSTRAVRSLPRVAERPLPGARYVAISAHETLIELRLVSRTSRERGPRHATRCRWLTRSEVRRAAHERRRAGAGDPGLGC